MRVATALLNDYAISHPTVQDRAAAPLFLAFMHQTVHEPVEARGDGGMAVDPRCAEAPGDFWRKVFCSMIVELDDATLELETTFKTLDLWPVSLTEIVLTALHSMYPTLMPLFASSSI